MFGLFLCTFALGPAGADPPPPDVSNFPRASDHSAAAGAAFDARANAIFQFNACGIENDFLGKVSELLAHPPNYKHQGEGLTDIVVAKIAAWNQGNGCLYQQWQPFPPTACPKTDTDGNPQELLAADCATLATLGCVTTRVLQVPNEPPLSEASAGQDCLRSQINTVLKLYQKHDQPGSSGLPCIPVLSGTFGAPIVTHGEYDFNLYEILRALYLGSQPNSQGLTALDQDTSSHLLDDLLTVRGSPGEASYSPITGCGDREDSTGSPQDYADSQAWLNRAGDTLANAADYVLKRWFLLLLLYLTGPLGPLISSLSMGAAAAGPAVFAGPVLLGVVAIAIDPFPFARLPETENHRLLIETSRYLTNQAIISDLEKGGNVDPNLGVVVSQQAEVKDWLLHRLQQIAKQDFDEYNARPYTRLSLNAIINLYDFSFDPDLQTAAQIILDYDSAKAAIGGNRSRRFAPYRRLNKYDGTTPGKLFAGNFYNIVEGGDHHVVRMIVLAGQTQLAEKQAQLGPNPKAPAAVEQTADTENPNSPFSAPDGLSTDGTVQNFVSVATSLYRLPDPVLELAVDRPRSFERIHHAGVEIYSSGPSFLLSAGGITTPAANHLYFIFGSGADAGIAMPIVVMPTEGGLTINNVIRFDGIGTANNREDGACVADRFACGINLKIPDLTSTASYTDCEELQTVDSVHWTFIDSARCEIAQLNWRERSAPPTPSASFFLAAAVHNCPSDDEVCGKSGVNNYGMLEIVDAPVGGPDSAYEAFKSSRIAALSWPPGRKGTYTLSGDGGTVVFDVLGSRSDSGGIISVNGTPIPNISDWPFANGQIVSAGDGLIWVTGPIGKKTLTLDFRQWNAPKWSCSPLPCF